MKGNNQEAEWLKYLKNELGNDIHLQERVVISVKNVTKQSRKVPNWKAPGNNDIQLYWIKGFSNLHGRIAIHTNKILMEDDSLLAWMTHGRIVLCQKDPRKEKLSSNHISLTDMEAFNRRDSWIDM